VNTVGKVRAPNAGRRLGAPNMYWPHIWWLTQAVKRGVDCNERLLTIALIVAKQNLNICEYVVYVNKMSMLFKY
jgi:hypothetical protein